MKWPRVMPSYCYCPSNVEYPRERPNELPRESRGRRRDKFYTQWRRHRIREAMKR